ncbi:glycosyltransferase [Photobacterium lipolyticum]|nr:glycosyltransferase [Photobacterium lipolyticum]
MAENGPKKKVIQVTECFAYGTAKSLKQLSGLLKDEYEIVVFYCRRDGTESEIKDIDSDITWVEMSSEGLFRHIANILKVRSFIDKNTHAIHGHSSYGGMYARLASIGKHVPYVFYSPRAYSFLRQDINWVVRQVFLIVEICLSVLGRTVSCGPAEFNIGKKFTKRIFNINNAVVIKDRPSSHNNDDEFKVISVGRICHQKAFDTFVDVAKNLSEIKFTWIGSSDLDYRQSVIDKKGGLPDNINIIEYMDQSDLFEEISQSSLIFHPSRWEGLSRTLIESLALGIPIVTSTCQSNLDCLHPRRDAKDSRGEYDNGYACKTVEEYVNAIKLMKDDPKRLARMSQASYTLAKREFNVNVTNKRWLDLYKGELNSEYTR